MTDTAIVERPRLISAAKAARELSIGRATMSRLIASGAVRGVRIGRCVRVVTTDIDALIERGGTTRPDRPAA